MMRWNSKAAVSVTVLALTIAAVMGSAKPSLAEPVSGNITIVAADPGDYFVVGLDQNGHCGSGYFLFKRSNSNFKDMVALVLTAFAANKGLTVFVTDCVDNNRNIISHAYTGR